MSGKSRQSIDAQLVDHLARGASQVAAAAAAGVSARTVGRRLADPEFVRAVDEFRQQMFEAAAGQASDLMVEAIGAMRELLRTDTPPATKLSAAKAIVDYSLRLNEELILARKVRQIEERFAELKQRRGA